MRSENEIKSRWVVGSGFFFFSSRRRHTRFDCDWSSDVCSSDLDGKIGFRELLMAAINFSLVSMPANVSRPTAAAANELRVTMPGALPAVGGTFRSEERRGGEEGRSRGSPDH